MTSTKNPEVQLPPSTHTTADPGTATLQRVAREIAEAGPGEIVQLPPGVEPRQIVPVPKPYFTRDEINLIKSTIMKGKTPPTDDELKLFLMHCERTGLNPFARQIYSIERREQRDGQWVTGRGIQVSIDGLRLVAERTGKYAGQVGPWWCGEDGEWRDVWLDQEAPTAARVGILRHDFKEVCWGVARFDSYAPRMRDGTLPRMWHVMGDVMIAKCAEALGLRKAFPQETSGLYTTDEMEQAGDGSSQITYQPPAQQDMVSPEQVEQMEILLKAGRKDIRKRFFDYVSKLLNRDVTELKEIPHSHFATIFTALQNEVKKAPAPAAKKKQKAEPDDGYPEDLEREYR